MRRRDRGYQLNGVKAIRAAFRRGVRRLLYVLPTGGGKTVVACQVIKAEFSAKRRVLVLTDSREILSQWVAQLIAAGVPENSIGTIMSNDERHNPDAPIQVATVQTLTRRLKARPRADLLVIDEAHASVARSYARISLLYAGRRVLGLTATPCRLDGVGLREAFDEILCGPSTSELIADGFLAKPSVWSIARERASELTKGIRKIGGDYSKGQLARRCSRRRIVGSVVEHWLDHGVGSSTVVYAVTKRHGHTLARAFRASKRVRAMGLPVTEIYDTTPKEKRDQILARMNAGETMIVVTVAVLTKGWDCPAAKCCVMARPTESLSLWLQIVGRFLRPWRGIRPVVVDHAGNVHKHGLPQRLQEWTLDGAKGPPPDQKTKEPVVKYCKECGHCNEAYRTSCANCGTELVEDRAPEETEAPLVEVGPTPEERKEIRERVYAMAKVKSAPPGWAEKVIAAMIGEVA